MRIILLVFLFLFSISSCNTRRNVIKPNVNSLSDNDTRLVYAKLPDTNYSKPMPSPEPPVNNVKTIFITNIVSNNIEKTTEKVIEKLVIITNYITNTQNNYITNTLIIKDYDTEPVVILTNTNSIRISGEVDILEGGRVKNVAISINNNPYLSIESVNNKWSYRFENLLEGTNIINAYSFVNNDITSETNKILVIVHTKGPEITLTYPQNKEEIFTMNLPLDINVNGSVYDEYGINFVDIITCREDLTMTNRYRAKLSGNNFGLTISFGQLGKYYLWIEANDKLNNMSFTKPIEINIISRPKLKISLSDSEFDNINNNVITQDKRTNTELFTVDEPYKKINKYEGKWRRSNNCDVIIVGDSGMMIASNGERIPITIEYLNDNSIIVKEKNLTVNYLKNFMPEEIAKQIYKDERVNNAYYKLKLNNDDEITGILYGYQIYFDKNKKVNDIKEFISKEKWLRIK